MIILNVYCLKLDSMERKIEKIIVHDLESNEFFELEVDSERNRVLKMRKIKQGNRNDNQVF